METSALAAFLHSFYTGIESIFRRIARELDGGEPSGQAWHGVLLQNMAQPASARPAVISSELCERLKPYLAFRHVFRGAYAFDLQWEKMAPLVLDAEALFRDLAVELAVFSSAMDQAEG